MGDEHGPQPLEAVMLRHGLTPADLVKASTEQLSFKMVQKGRKGRRLTPNIQKKILNALRRAIAARPSAESAADTGASSPSLTLKDLFNYT